MSNRYVTEAEKAGTKRRKAAYLTRLAETGIKRRQLLLTDTETQRVKDIVACWRDEPCDLIDEELRAAKKLKPNK
ncbi:hypothetical protein CAP31_08835 [Sulfuriferula sp. AH1]|uniref:hypothetical protein n=1 Tax=Sulfuriferula sp. AH1 TaxID=1985873 RepID=UPI000B3B15C4|nr:hypothetical protein [Sulfuriferula sp. AH1]ARU31775.1 hypothetical protein CAP31_08835 [Sulfuriferula sp. AH1]